MLHFTVFKVINVGGGLPTVAKCGLGVLSPIATDGYYVPDLFQTLGINLQTKKRLQEQNPCPPGLYTLVKLD